VARRRKTATPAPEGLSEQAQTLWIGVVEDSPPGRAAIIEAALRAFDRAGEASAILDRDGLTVTTATTGAVHVHPAVKIERDNRTLFARLWAQLELQKDDSWRY